MTTILIPPIVLRIISPVNASFIVEDGSGLAGANSYSDVATANQYHLNHGNPPTWTNLSENDRRFHLREGTQFLDGEYRARYRGTKRTLAQALEHPRNSIVDKAGFRRASDELVREIIDACAIAAFRSAEAAAANTVLVPVIVDEGTVKKTRKRLDVLEEEIVYESPNLPTTTYRLLEFVLDPILHPRGGVIR